MFDILTQRLSKWRLRHTTRRQLAWLDDRLLADIGTTRESISDFVALKCK